MSLGSTTSSLSPLSNISIASPPAPPPAAITPRPQASPIAAASTCQRSDAPGKDKNRKKSKTKSQPKTRTIKFHEYKVSLSLRSILVVALYSSLIPRDSSLFDYRCICIRNALYNTRENESTVGILILSLFYNSVYICRVKPVGVNAQLLCTQGANILLKLGRTRK